MLFRSLSVFERRGDLLLVEREDDRTARFTDTLTACWTEESTTLFIDKVVCPAKREQQVIGVDGAEPLVSSTTDLHTPHPTIITAPSGSFTCTVTLSHRHTPKCFR